ncbi:YybS family protein [Synechococcus sp. CS-1332]|uniref:YybS family protein n=1 Tax=Synechococcus sp. CS-1332 TaxID=2847972 RepID=UPI00223B23DB|nr:YybS family protein [Synechococcus sp. CS-1332]MCT0207178.1 YybS family protein [Synechococcus sp. CS-1332]
MTPPSRRQLSPRQARQLMDTAYLAASTALLWVALYYLPVGSPLFRLALPLPLALLQLRHGWRCALEGVVVTALLLVALMGPIRGPLVLFPYGLLSLWLGWGWRHRRSWWLTLGVGSLIGAAGFLVRVAVLSVLVGENLWVVITTAAANLLDRLAGVVGLAGGFDLAQVQVAALLLVLLQNLIVVLALHAVAYWIFPRLDVPISEPPAALRGLVALDPL